MALIDALAVLKKRGALKGNPLKQMVAAVSVGIYQGVPVLDLTTWRIPPRKPT